MGPWSKLLVHTDMRASNNEHSNDDFNSNYLKLLVLAFVNGQKPETVVQRDERSKATFHQPSLLQQQK